MSLKIFPSVNNVNYCIFSLNYIVAKVQVVFYLFIKVLSANSPNFPLVESYKGPDPNIIESLQAIFIPNKSVENCFVALYII